MPLPTPNSLTCSPSHITNEEPATNETMITRAGQLPAPLRDRFGVNLRLELYSPEELQKIVERSAGILKVEIDSAGAYEIASRSRGTPRIANRLLKRVRDYAQVRADGVITKEVANAALLRLEVDELGGCNARGCL